MAAYFVTATGTDTGKTFVAAALLRGLARAGVAGRALKPVVSGFPGADVSRSDPAVLLAAMGRTVSQEAIAAIAPWRFAAPLSPGMAAAREGRNIPYTELLAWCRGELARAAGPMLVEGAGGVMVPLDASHTIRDLMAGLGLPVILIAGSYLGTISHTLTALDSLAAAGLTPALVVVNDTGVSPVPLAQTAAAITRFAPAVPIAVLPRDPDHAAIAPLLRLLWPATGGDATP